MQIFIQQLLLLNFKFIVVPASHMYTYHTYEYVHMCVPLNRSRAATRLLPKRAIVVKRQEIIKLII